MICAKCGGDMGEAARFCPHCGSHRPAVAGPATDGDPRIGTTLEGKYRIDARIGAGGMATVYRATRLMIGDAVAVKILHAGTLQDSGAPERFRREAQAAARLKHNNVVTVHDFGVADDGTIYLVMELVEGESLRTLIERAGPMPPPDAAEILEQACAALDSAHAQGVVHRDLKPDNVVVSRRPAGLHVEVLDFGIARLQDAAGVGTLTQQGKVLGTPHYMSPEQCLGEKLDGRSDIYSLGVVLYEMLSGAVPFDATTSMAVAVKHVNADPPPLRAANPDVPAPVETVVRWALRKRPDDRPASAGALATAMKQAVTAGTPAPASGGTGAARPVEEMKETVRMPSPGAAGAGPRAGRGAPRAGRGGPRARGGARRRPVTAAAVGMVLIAAVWGWWSFGTDREGWFGTDREAAEPAGVEVDSSAVGEDIAAGGPPGGGEASGSPSAMPGGDQAAAAVPAAVAETSGAGRAPSGASGRADAASRPADAAARPADAAAARADAAAGGAAARARTVPATGGAGASSPRRARGAGNRPAARPAPRPVSEGRLTIRTLPESVVELDGVEVGTTNAAGILAVDGIAAGRHVVVARKPGYGDATATAGVMAGRSEVVELSLVELPGRLTATADTPGATLLVDGVGEYPLPLRGLELPTGRRRLTASRPGFMPVVEEVDVRPGEDAALSFSLERVPVEVALREAQGHFNLRRYREAANGAEAVLREYGEAGEAYLLLGRSLHAQRRFEESADYLGRAVEAGQEVELPAKHRHGGLGLRAGFCDGVMIVSRRRVIFRSTVGADHSFAVTPDRIRSVDVGRDRINTQIVMLEGGRERERDFDFIHTNTVRQSSRDSSFFTETSCRGCDDSLLVLGAVLQKARGL